MVEDAAVNGDAGICARAIKRFPQFFRRKSNTFLTREMRYWSNREGIISQYRANVKRGNGHYYQSQHLKELKLWLVRLVMRGGVNSQHGALLCTYIFRGV